MHKGFVLWLTGLSGAGKSTIANILEARLRAAGAKVELLDFRSPPADVKFPVVIGSDLMYEERLVDPLVGLLAAVLVPGGVCLIADPDRLAARVFRWKLEEAGFDVTTELVRAGEPGGERTRGTLYRIRHALE